MEVNYINQPYTHDNSLELADYVLVEYEWRILPGHVWLTPPFAISGGGVHITQSLVLCVVYCRSNYEIETMLNLQKLLYRNDSNTPSDEYASAWCKWGEYTPYWIKKGWSYSILKKEVNILNI